MNRGNEIAEIHVEHMNSTYGNEKAQEIMNTLNIILAVFKLTGIHRQMPFFTTALRELANITDMYSEELDK